MDINMSNVRFYKVVNDDNWVYLGINGNGKNGIKVFYDDGTL